MAKSLVTTFPLMVLNFIQQEKKTLKHRKEPYHPPQ